MNFKEIIKLIQGENSLYLTKFKFNELEKYCKILTYKDDKIYGYQRTPNPSQYVPIKKVFLDNNEFIFPTAIILGIDNIEFNKLYCENSIHLSKIDGPVFRIIDGQHRFIGLKEAINEAKEESKINELKNIEFPVIIIPINENNRGLEVNIFCDVNFKAKRLKSDLAFLSKYRYELIDYKTTKKLKNSIEDHIAVKVIFYLMKNTKIWKNAFLYDSFQEENKGIISFLAFKQSINKIVKNHNIQSTSSTFIEDIENYAKNISEHLLIPCWDFVSDIWKEAFNLECPIFIDDDIKIYYNSKYLIQKSFGVKIINGIISDIYIDTNSNFETTISKFKEVLKLSMLTSNDWISGGLFRGLSSESAYLMVKNKILNNEIVDFKKNLN